MLIVANHPAGAVLAAAPPANGPAGLREPGSAGSFARVLSRSQDHSEAQRQRAGAPPAREGQTRPAQPGHPSHPSHPTHPTHPSHPAQPPHPAHPAQSGSHGVLPAGEAALTGPTADAAASAAAATDEATPSTADTTPGRRSAGPLRGAAGSHLGARPASAHGAGLAGELDPEKPARKDTAGSGGEHGVPPVCNLPIPPEPPRIEACGAAPQASPDRPLPAGLDGDPTRPVGPADDPAFGAAPTTRPAPAGMSAADVADRAAATAFRLSDHVPAGAAAIGGMAPGEALPAALRSLVRGAPTEPGLPVAPGIAWAGPAPLASLAAPTVLQLATAVAAPDFARTLAVQVSILAQDGVQQARLELNPGEMGPVSVKIVIDGQQAKVEFGADVQATRSAIEAGLPELASALREAGFTLTGGGVSQHARDPDRGQPGDAGPGRSGVAGSAQDRAAGADRAAADAPVQRRVRAGGVDLYA